MIIIGLTGSIGMGKSTVSALFGRLKIPVFDADAAVHELQGANGALVDAIECLFPGTTGEFGVDRQKLGAAVFGRPLELKALERLIHPSVARLRRAFLNRHRSRPIVVLDVPLLFETRGWRYVDDIVVVSAPAWLQRRRVMARSNMSYAKFRAINRLQVRDAIKRRRADVIIETARPINATRAAVRALVACISARGVR